MVVFVLEIDEYDSSDSGSSLVFKDIYTDEAEAHRVGKEYVKSGGAGYSVEPYDLPGVELSK